jgi:hypothetical protein
VIRTARVLAIVALFLSADPSHAARRSASCTCNHERTYRSAGTPPSVVIVTPSQDRLEAYLGDAAEVHKLSEYPAGSESCRVLMAPGSKSGCFALVTGDKAKRVTCFAWNNGAKLDIKPLDAVLDRKPTPVITWMSPTTLRIKHGKDHAQLLVATYKVTTNWVVTGAP